MIQPRLILTLTVLSILPATLTGCAGYVAGDQFDPSIKTISIPIFKNKTFDRKLEFQLTEALIKEIESRTPYRVAKSGTADTVLEGEIVEVERQWLSRTFTGGLTQETQLIVWVDFQWKDARTGKLIRKRTRLPGTGEYIPTYPVGQPIEVAKTRAVHELSQSIVAAMRRDW